MVLVMINMFVAIIGDAHLLTTEEIMNEAGLLKRKGGKSAELGLFSGCVRWLRTWFRKNKETETKSQPTIFDANDDAKDIRIFLKTRGELRDAEEIRQKVLRREKIRAHDMTSLFKGDVLSAMEFVSKLSRVYRGQDDTLKTG